jgi:hypothetical protein
VPLAPYEAFHPWWGHGVSNVTNVNINVTRNVYVNNTVNYRNLEVHNAMTSVTMQNFQAGRFSHPVAVSNDELRSYHPVAVRGALPIVPTEANLRYSDRAVPAVAVRQAAFTRSFAGSQAVTPRTSFRTQQATVARTQQLPMPAYSHAAAASNDPWSRFNAYHGTNAAPSDARPESSAYNRAAVPSYARPEGQAYGHAATPSYARPEASQGYARPATSSYARPSTPYMRPSSPSYARSAAPAYHVAAPSRSAPAAAHASHTGGDDHRDR